MTFAGPMSASEWKPYDPCSCGCGVIGWKTTRPLEPGSPAHVLNCNCSTHRAKRNVKKGKRAQARTHTNLGGQGFTPHHEESGVFYDLTVRPEVKTGVSVPVSIREFVKTRWFLDALRQCESAIPMGIDARPAVSIDGRWLVVDIRSRKEARKESIGETPA